MEEKTVIQAPAGLENIKISVCDGVLVGVTFTDEPPTGVTKGAEETVRWLETYFSGRQPSFMPRYEVKNRSVFRTRVLCLLTQVPYGKTVTYGELAKKYCAQYDVKRMSAQAIGGAVGSNPLAIVLPCHRVVGADGSLTGYAYGLDNKKELLKREGIIWEKTK